MQPRMRRALVVGPSPFTLLIGMLVAGYFGYNWRVDPPTSETISEFAFPRLLDFIYKGSLFVSAALLLGAAGLSAAEKPLATRVAFVGEAVFAITFGAMAVDTLIEQRSFDFDVFLTGILCFFGASRAADLWRRMKYQDTTNSATDTFA